MKKFFGLFAFAILIATLMPSCKKKTEGICYCHYFSGDKKEYDLRMLKRSQQQDSCYVLDGLASGFAGDCDLK